jgi:hypothetical protein
LQRLGQIARPRLHFFEQPVLHGALTDRFGFQGSFALGTLTAVIALWLVWRLPRWTEVESREIEEAKRAKDEKREKDLQTTVEQTRELYQDEKDPDTIRVVEQISELWKKKPPDEKK